MISPDDPRSGRSPWQGTSLSTQLKKEQQTTKFHVRYNHHGELESIDHTKETQLIPRQRSHVLSNITMGVGGVIELTGFGGLMLEASSHTFVDNLNQFFMAEMVVGAVLVIGTIVRRNRR